MKHKMGGIILNSCLKTWYEEINKLQNTGIEMDYKQLDEIEAKLQEMYNYYKAQEK